MTPEPQQAAIALVGMMGAGKTAVGAALAARLALPFRDLDAEVEREAGCTVADLFAREGEAGFRAREHAALERLLDGTAMVLATGGGAVLDGRNRALLQDRARTIWLDAPPAALARRLASARDRPLLRGGDPEIVLARLLEERRSLYVEAEIRFGTKGRSPAEIAAALAAMLRT